MERVVRFDTLGTTFIPRIFEAKDWANLFGNFEDLMEDLVREFFLNARYIGVELKCWERGKEFSISPNYIAKVLRITRPEDVDLTPYDDRTPKDILQVLGPDHGVSSIGTSISTAKFALELTTLKLIMFSNLYPLSNTAFINLGRAQFLSDFITAAPIDICAHIFQIIGKTAARSTTRACIPFCSLIMKIMLLEGVNPPSDGKMMNHPRPISMITLQASKSHSSKAPKSEHISLATPYAHGSDRHVHTTTISPVTPELQPTSNRPVQSGPQADRLGPLFENLHMRSARIERLIYSTNNQVQLCLTTMENQLDAIQQKLENNL